MACCVRALIAVLIPTIVWGCGDSSSSSSDAVSKMADTAASVVGTADACAMLTADEVASAVGNPVLAGQPAGAGSCKWDREQPEQTSLLIIVHPEGNIRTPILCEGVQRAASAGVGMSGIGDAAKWDFSNTMGLFNSAALEACSAKGYVNVSVNGKGDEATLKNAATSIANTLLERL